jgi:hypothetical protein
LISKHAIDTSAPQRPERSGSRCIRLNEVTVDEHDLGGNEVVNRTSSLADEGSVSTTKAQPDHAA